MNVGMLWVRPFSTYTLTCFSQFSLLSRSSPPSKQLWKLSVPSPPAWVPLGLLALLWHHSSGEISVDVPELLWGKKIGIPGMKAEGAGMWRTHPQSVRDRVLSCRMLSTRCHWILLCLASLCDSWGSEVLAQKDTRPINDGDGTWMWICLTLDLTFWSLCFLSLIFLLASLPFLFPSPVSFLLLSPKQWQWCWKSPFVEQLTMCQVPCSHSHVLTHFFSQQPLKLGFFIIPIL